MIITDGSNSSPKQPVSSGPTYWKNGVQVDPITGQPVQTVPASSQTIEIQQAPSKIQTISGGMIYVDPSEIAQVIPPGSTVVADIDQIKVTEPSGATEVYKPPTQEDVDKIDSEITNLNERIDTHNQLQSPSEAETAAILKDSVELQRKAVMTNAVIDMRRAENETRPVSQQKPQVTKASGITAAKVADTAADLLVPGYYTVTHWNKMNNWERALSIGTDALSIVPVFGAFGKGAKVATTLSKTARLTAAAKAGASELTRQVLWPVDMVKAIRHPIAAVKSVKATTLEMVSGLENIIRPTKLPESVVINTMHSAKIPVSVAGGEKEAMAARDAIMTARKQGAFNAVINVGEVQYELYSTPLMKKTGGLAHGAQDVSLFDAGLVVKEIPTKPQIEQGLFLAPNPIGRYAMGDAAQAGKAIGTKSGIFITSQKYAAEVTRSSGKLYAHTAELESVVGVGKQLEKPAQKLFTRINGERVEIYLAEKLSTADIVKLKAAGLTESVKSLYQPTLEVKGLKNLTKKEVNALADAIYGTDRQVARNVRRVGEAAFTGAGRTPSSVLRSASERGYILEVQTRVKNASSSRPEITTSRKITKVKPRRGQTLDEALREKVIERSNRKDYRDISPTATERVSRRVEDSRTGRIEAPRREAPRVDRIRGTPEVGRGRVPPRADEPLRGRETGKKVDIGTPRIRLADGREVTVSRVQLEGSYFWRQGFVWKLWLKPFDKSPITLTEKPMYAKEATGPGSPQRSLTESGVSKGTPALPMGIVSIQVVNPKHGKSKLVYRRLSSKRGNVASEVQSSR